MFENEKGLDEQAYEFVDKGYMVLGQQTKAMPPVGVTGRAEWSNDYFQAAWIDEPDFLSIRMREDTFALDVDTDPKSGHATEAMENLQEMWEEFLHIFPIDPVRTGANLYNSAGIYHFKMDGVTEAEIATINVENLDVIRKGHRFAVVRGTHPKTGNEYRGSLPHIDELPEFTEEMLAWWLERSAPKTYREPGAVDVQDMPALVPITEAERARLDKYDCAALSERDWSAVGGRKRLLFGMTQRAAFRLSGSPTERMGKALAYIEPWVQTAYENADRSKAKRYASIEHFWADNTGLSECLELLGKGLDGSMGRMGHIGHVGRIESDVPSCPLEDTYQWLRRFIYASDDDLRVLATWVVHTYLVNETYTTPRLLIGSFSPGCGKTTVLDHMARLAHKPVNFSSISSDALLARVVATEPRTLLIDEADRTLRADNPNSADFLAVLNSGYRKGGSRPVLKANGKDWEADTNMSTFAPVVMAGNKPNLPEDTQQRCIKVVLYPDTQEIAEESDWEEIEPDAKALGERIRQWAVSVKEEVKAYKPVMPDGVRGRLKEKWSPLVRVAHFAGDDWEETMRNLAANEYATIQQDIADGNGYLTEEQRLGISLTEVIKDGEKFIPTAELVERLHLNDESWEYLTPKRLSNMLSGINVRGAEVEPQRGYTDGKRVRGYRVSDLKRVMDAVTGHLKASVPSVPSGLSVPSEGDAA